MSKIEEKLNELTTIITSLETEASKRSTVLKQLRENFSTSFNETVKSQEMKSQNIGKLENEIKLLTSSIENEKKLIQTLKDDVNRLSPESDDLTSQVQTLEARKAELTGSIAGLDEELTSKKSQRNSLEVSKNEKQGSLSALETSIEEKVKINQEELERAKSNMTEVRENNLVWDFLFEKMDNPDIEIMAIIAGNRKISLDNIKTKATGVSPVFVGRSLAKLESDGKITQDAEGLWDLSVTILQAINLL